MKETMNLGALFVSAVGVSYKLFIHNCPEKEEIANLIEVSKRSPEFGIILNEATGVYMLVIEMQSYTIMRRLTTGIRSEKCVVKRFRRRANVLVYCTYTNQDSTAYYTPRLYGIAYCS